MVSSRKSLARQLTAIEFLPLEPRSKKIIKLLSLCFASALLASTLKMSYGYSTNTLSFVADGIHSLLDALATFLGILSVILSSRPPDSDHPYGHQKFEVIASLALAIFLLFAAYEVATIAYGRLKTPEVLPTFSYVGLWILVFTMVLSFVLARWESDRAKVLSSSFLATDSVHNFADFALSLCVLMSLFGAHHKIPHVDGVVTAIVAGYLVFLSLRLFFTNLQPLVDHSVLDADEVESIVVRVKGVLHCHAIRSRGLNGRQFLDLNIHLSGSLSLDLAHEITHEVETRLKETFPSLVDVVIHTEPHHHPPCSKGG